MGRLPARPSARRSTTTPRRGTFARWSSTAASAASTTPCCAPGRAPRWSRPSTSTRTATTRTSTTLEFARPRRTYTGCRCRRSISSTAGSGCSRRRASRSRVKATGRTKTTDARNRSFDCWKRVLPKLRDPPTHLLVENVVGFERSETRHTAVRTLHDLGYDTREFMCSPRMFGVPYSRPRYFLLAKKKTIGWADGDWDDGDEYPARNEGPQVWESRLHRCQPPSRLSATKEWVPAGVKCVYPRDFDGDTKAEYEARQIKHGASPEPDPSLPTYGYPVALMGAFLGWDGSTGIMGHGDDEEMRSCSVRTRYRRRT